MFLLRAVFVLALIGTIGGGAISSAFAQNATPELSAGGKTIGGPATLQGNSEVIWRATEAMTVCVSAVPSTATTYTLTFAPKGGSRSHSGPTSTCANDVTSVTLATGGQPVTWRVDKPN
jgi:hypothetical protein